MLTNSSIFEKSSEFMSGFDGPQKRIPQVPLRYQKQSNQHEVVFHNAVQRKYDRFNVIIDYGKATA